MVDRAAELARDSHARTRHAAVLMTRAACWAGERTESLSGEDHCYCKVAEVGNHDQCRTHAEQRAISLARQGEGWRRLQARSWSMCGSRRTTRSAWRIPTSARAAAGLALSLGVAEWIFALSDGLVGYSATDYDTISQLRW